MRKLLLSAALAPFLLSAPQIIFAQEAEEAADSTDSGDDDTTKTFLAFLGLKALDGKNTVGEGAGEIEAHIIATAMAQKAADTIITKVNGQIDNTVTVVPRSKTEIFDLSPYFILQDFLNVADIKIPSLAVEAAKQCKAPGGGNKGVGFQPAIAGLDGADADRPDFKLDLSDFVGLARTENALSKVDVSLGEAVLTNAFFEITPRNGNWIIPEEITIPTDKGDLATRLKKAEDKLPPFLNGTFCAAGQTLSKESKEKVATAAGKIRDEIVAVKAPKDGTPSLLHRASLITQLAEDTTGGASKIRILRYSVDKAGGTLVNTSNLFTSVGVPGITIRGGMVVTYRFVDPLSGKIEFGGTITCTMPKLLLMTVTGTTKDIKEEVTCV